MNVQYRQWGLDGFRLMDALSVAITIQWPLTAPADTPILNGFHPESL